MEGGYLPWKNKSIVVADELDSLNKPLPSPPVGFVWSKDCEGVWVLVKVDESANVPERSTSDPSVIYHDVQPEDTLQGICLRYGVSIMEVRRVNMFSGNAIQHIKILRIPLIKGVSPVGDERDSSKEAILQRFRDETKESIAESRLYLEDNHWDLTIALSAWRGDESWESNQPPHAFGCEDLMVSASVRTGNTNGSGSSSKKLD